MALQQGLFGDTAARARRGPPRSIRLLLVEDSHDDAWMVQRQLERGGFAPDILRVQDASGVHGALRGGRWDLVIVDYALPDLCGLDAIRIVRQHCTNLPCLMVSGTVGEQVAVEAMRLGANDYVHEGQPHASGARRRA